MKDDTTLDRGTRIRRLRDAATRFYLIVDGNPVHKRLWPIYVLTFCLGYLTGMLLKYLFG